MLSVQFVVASYLILNVLMSSGGVQPSVTLQGLERELEKENQSFISKQFYMMTTVFINNTIYVNVSEPFGNMSLSTVAMTTTPCPTPDAVFLAKIKAITLVVISCVGLLIVGCLLFCMFYQNERLLNQLPWRRKRDETEHVFDMATMLAQSAAAELGIDVDEILKGGPKSVLPYLEVLQQASMEQADVAMEDTQLPVDCNPEGIVGDSGMLPSLEMNHMPRTPHVLHHYSEPIPPPAPHSPGFELTVSSRRPPRTMKQIAKAVIVADSFRMATSMRPPPSSGLGRASSRMGLSSISDNTPVGGLGLASASRSSAPGHGGIFCSPLDSGSLQNSHESLLLSDDEDLMPEIDFLTDTESLTAISIPLATNNEDEFYIDSLS